MTTLSVSTSRLRQRLENLVTWRLGVRTFIQSWLGRDFSGLRQSEGRQVQALTPLDSTTKTRKEIGAL